MATYSSDVNTVLPSLCILTFWVAAKLARSDLNMHHIISVGLVDPAAACGTVGYRSLSLTLAGFLGVVLSS